MADGAVGYLENDEENLKIFSVVSKVLRSGGRFRMRVCESYADFSGKASLDNNIQLMVCSVKL